MTTDEEKEIFYYLHNLGCCANCCLRYLCNKFIDYSETSATLKEKGFITNDENDETPQKKIKSNPCLVCLGLLQNETLALIIAHPDIEKAKEYDSEVFTVSISMPASILVREHSMRLHLEDKFPLFYNDDNDEIPLNRAWKMFVKDSVSKHIGKTFQSSDVCDFSLNICMDYSADDEELIVLKEMQPKLFETRTVQHRKYSGELFSRKGVLTALEHTQSGVFKMYGKVPPDVPSFFLSCKGVECKHNCIYIAGRYCKFSRELSQSPWIIDGVKTMETSVQEIIFGCIKDILGIPEENMKFSSSGREDCDVRCLGKGRPFYVEFADPKKTEFEYEEFRNLENSINLSSVLKVIDLQKVKRSELTEIKKGEESKTKNYVALCVTKSSITQEMLDKINNYGLCEISQKTPIRVLHRRPLAIRTRRIEEMSALVIPDYPNCFELNVVTQAGTYVKEFVHGDFGRTKPNIGNIIGTEVDIAALDVVAINLDWPKHINYDQ